MNRMTVRKQRRILRGWIKWVPVVAIPFSILFFHTWLNIQIIQADYELRELDAEARDWSEKLNFAGVTETYLEDPGVLAEQAEIMAFHQPSPGQREVIYYDPTVPVLPEANPNLEDENFAIAQREDVAAEPDPAVTENLPAPSPPAFQAPEPAAAPTVQPEVAVALTEPAEPALETAPAAPERSAAPVMVETSVPLPALDSAVAISPAPDGPAVVTGNPVGVEDLEAAMESFESL